MHIFFNSEKIELKQFITLQQMLTQQGLHDHFFAVAINRRVVLRRDYHVTLLKEGDVIDIVRPMQGG